MADSMGGGGPATSNGNGASSRPAAARAPVGSPAGVRGPRAIMQERAAREARAREERERLERLEREHAIEEARKLEEAQRRQAERQAGYPGAAAAAGAGTSNEPSGSGRVNLGQTLGRTKVDDPSRGGGPSRTQQTTQPQPSSQRHGRTSSNAAQNPGSGAAAAAAAAATGAPSSNQPLPGEPSAGGARAARNSFPHAFERWETLSAHWEGLTSFWIRRLEQNAAEISSDPLSQQLARQVTDLSSAGANLFHAVVELQRLRASSERKFQRWFFEIRAEGERNQEVTAMLEAALEEERRSRADAIQSAIEQEQGNSKYQKQLAEMRKELTISKEEARRAWEELGRREQEERDRTTSLQMGNPTIVGGVQVVPMTQGLSRGNSQRDPRSYANPEPEYAASTGSRPEYTASTASRPEYTAAPAVQPVVTSASGAYQPPPATVHHRRSFGSEGTYSEEEYETPQAGPAAQQQPGGAAQHQQQPQYSSEPDYTGAGYSAPGWEQMPRHHHPTRLSDVIEEDDERSRTSASQSQVSRG